MADTKLADLTALTVPSGDDLLYVVDDPAGTPSDKKLALDNLFTRGTLNGTLLNMSQTWGGTGTYTGIKYDVTDSGPSNAASLLMDLQVGGASKFYVRKDGAVVAATGGKFVADTIDGGGNTMSSGGVFLSSSAFYRLNNDTFIGRRGAANLRFGAADAAGSSIAISSVDTTARTLTLASAHGLTSGAQVQFTTTGSLPGGISAATTYYARVINSTTIEIYFDFGSATATSGTAGRVNLTSAGSDSSCQRSAPFQTLSVQNFTGTDIPGQPLIIDGSQGTGNGDGGAIIFRLAPRGSSGSAQNGLTSRLTISPNGFVQLTNRLFVPDILLSGGAGTGAANQWTPTVLNLPATSSLAFNRDVWLVRDAAANTLALQNGANAQAFRLYNTFTDATTFERANIFWDSNVLKIGTEKGSVGGTARAIEFQTDGTTRLTIAATTGNVTTTGSVTTEAPTGGTAAAWRLGTVATVSPTSPNRTIEVDIGGTIYYLAAKTTND